MRVDLDGPSELVFLMQKYRPCPECGSPRVTVQEAIASTGSVMLAVRCADCTFALDAPARPDTGATAG